MFSWSEFAAAAPRLAEEIRAMLQQYGSGLGYLATVRPDGGPRVHPVAPIVADGGLFCFLIDSPKRRDLERDGRYALHSFPAEDSDVEAYLTGLAVPVFDDRRVERVARHACAGDARPWRLFELLVDVAMIHHPLGSPRVWRAPVRRPGVRTIDLRLSVLAAA